jgi:tetratricopeptide (TPR) repeat protein
MALYDAFISYSHAKDKPIAAALQSVMQKLGKPWYRRRELRLFRDDTSLSATPHLWPSIQQALDQSRFFILVASLEAAASKWVNKEVSYWLDHNSVDTLLIGVTDGEIGWDEKVEDFDWRDDTPLPRTLARRFASEPKWVDLRPYRGGANPRHSKFIELSADFAAAIHGMPKEDLLSQEVRQQRRTLTLAWSAAGSLLVLASLAGWQWNIAKKNEARANRNFSAAKKAADGLIIDLAGNLRNVRGVSQEITGVVLTTAQSVIDELVKNSAENPELLLSRITLFREFTKTFWFVGDIAKAREYVARSLTLVDELLASATDPARRLELLQNRYDDFMLQGDILRVLGELDTSLDSFRAAQASAEGIIELKPARDKQSWRQLGSARGRVGDVMRTDGRFAAAAEEYRAIEGIQRKFLQENREDRDWLSDLSWTHNRTGDNLLHITNHEGLMTVAADLTPVFKDNENAVTALDHYESSVRIRRYLASVEPNNNERRRDLIWSLSLLGMALLATDVQRAWQVLDEGRTEAVRLLATDPKNTEWLRYLALTRNFRGDALMLQDKRQEAFAEYDEGLLIRQNLSNIDPNNARWTRDLFYTFGRMYQLHRIAGDAEKAERFRASALKAAERARLGFPTDRVLADAIAGLRN